MQIAFFGSSLVSAYWNGAATYYRGMIRALHERGHSVTFYEPDAWERQQHRDIADPPWAKVIVYSATAPAALAAVEQAASADLIVKASGVGVFDELLETAVLSLKNSSNLIVFWDVDAPATLERVLADPDDTFKPLIPRYDAIFTYGGGEPVRRSYCGLGARQCTPIYNALDPQTHHTVSHNGSFVGDLAFLGNRLPDREARVDEFFFAPASELPRCRFLLGGSGWTEKQKSSNIHYFNHVFTADHNAFNSTPRLVLNVTRDSMARYGFSPATRVFEAAGAGACMISDVWEGCETFFDPGTEMLLANNGSKVVEYVKSISESEAHAIGERAYRRVLAQHTYAHRAAQFDSVVAGMQ